MSVFKSHTSSIWSRILSGQDLMFYLKYEHSYTLQLFLEFEEEEAGVISQLKITRT